MSLYITTPIYYVNAQPHLGHAYSTIVADTASRFHRLCGEQVRFQTGTDEHGDKVVEAAVKAGLATRDYVDTISAMFREAWPPLAIEPDNFIRTTDAAHIKTVKDILQRVYDKGDIYFGSYSGHYCQGCERFLTEKELVDGNCPDHLTPPALITEENYFFRMGKYQQWLIDHINSNPDFITPERYRNEVLSFLREPLEDLCISRPTSRLTWGIPLPFDEKYVTYVWFDALINYLTGIGYPDGPQFNFYWENAEHIIAKDILKPHAIYWPTMLKSMGVDPYRKLHVHGYWNVNETKMSKSIGNVVRPGQLVKEYGADTVRYFILREMSFGLDSSFSTEGLEARRNSDLANDLGNLFSRSLTMINKFAGGLIPQPAPARNDQELVDAVIDMVKIYRAKMNEFAFNQALQEIWKVISIANRYIVTNAPWELAKEEDKEDRLATVLYNLAEVLRILSLVLRPIMPAAADKMAEALGICYEKQPVLADLGKWGLSEPGTSVSVGAGLFPRLETKKQQQPGPQKTKRQKSNKQKAAVESTEQDGQISFDDFKKVDLRVAEIIAAEKIEKADRLLKLTVKAPEERTIVAGIAEQYQPDQLIGRKVIIVANLKPVKLRGVLSHGMVLAAKDNIDGSDRLTLTSILDDISTGSKVS